MSTPFAHLKETHNWSSNRGEQRGLLMDDEDDLDLDFVAVNTSTIAPNAVERHQMQQNMPEWEITAEDERAALEDDDDDVRLF